MFLQPPIEVILKWPAPTQHPSTRIPAANAIISIFLIVATITVGLRLFSRKFIVKSFGVDDWLVAAAYISFVGYIATLFVEHQHGKIGIHAWEFVTRQGLIPIILRSTFTGSIFHIISITLTKLSILYFYKRALVVEGINMIFNKILKIAVIAVSVLGVAMFISNIFQCWPVYTYWTYHVADAFNPPKCTTFSIYFVTVTDIAIDIFLLCLPAKPIWDLQMSSTRRFQLIVIFVFGGLSLVAAILRIPAVIKTANGYDGSWNAEPLMIWSGAEITIALCCVSAPAIRSMLIASKRRAPERAWIIPSQSAKNSFGSKSSKTSGRPGTTASGGWEMFERDEKKNEARNSTRQVEI